VQWENGQNMFVSPLVCIVNIILPYEKEIKRLNDLTPNLQQYIKKIHHFGLIIFFPILPHHLNYFLFIYCLNYR